MTIVWSGVTAAATAGGVLVVPLVVGLALAARLDTRRDAVLGGFAFLVGVLIVSALRSPVLGPIPSPAFGLLWGRGIHSFALLAPIVCVVLAFARREGPFEIPAVFGGLAGGLVASQWVALQGPGLAHLPHLSVGWAVYVVSLSMVWIAIALVVSLVTRRWHWSGMVGRWLLVGWGVATMIGGYQLGAQEFVLRWPLANLG